MKCVCINNGNVRQKERMLEKFKKMKKKVHMCMLYLPLHYREERKKSRKRYVSDSHHNSYVHKVREMLKQNKNDQKVMLSIMRLCFSCFRNDYKVEYQRVRY